MTDQRKLYGVIVGNSTELYDNDGDFGRLDEETAHRKARRLANETCDSVYIVQMRPVPANLFLDICS